MKESNLLSSDRGRVLAENLARVEEEIGKAAAGAGRNREEIKLIVVTKNFPVADCEILYHLGVRDFGENREQEGVKKAAYFSSNPNFQKINWHFQGQLQRNKLASIGAWASLIHSLDDAKYLPKLAQAAQKRRVELPILIQLSLDLHFQEGRAGVSLDGALELGEQVHKYRELNLAGIMAVAPLAEAPEPAFERLARYRAQFLADNPRAEICSAGMSQDFLAALAIGATHLRIGSSILGSRIEHR